jgi:hypothetical protein
MRHQKWVAVAVIALLLPLAANAGHRKPGLWEVTVQTNFTKGGPQIPPEVLERMKAAGQPNPLANLSAPHTAPSCLTAEEAAKDDHPDGGKNCKFESSSWSGNTFTGEMTCTSPRGGVGQMHGKIQAVADSDESYTGTVHMDGNDPAMGGDFTMDNKLQGKWVKADCGSMH